MRNLMLVLLFAACSPDDEKGNVRFMFSHVVQTDCPTGQVCSCPSLESWAVPANTDETMRDNDGSCRLLTEAGKFAELECNGTDGFLSAYRMVTLEKDGQWHTLDWTKERGFGCWYLANLHVD